MTLPIGAETSSLISDCVRAVSGSTPQLRKSMSNDCRLAGTHFAWSRVRFGSRSGARWSTFDGRSAALTCRSKPEQQVWVADLSAKSGASDWETWETRPIAEGQRPRSHAKPKLMGCMMGFAIDTPESRMNKGDSEDTDSARATFHVVSRHPTDPAASRMDECKHRGSTLGQGSGCT